MLSFFFNCGDIDSLMARGNQQQLRQALVIIVTHCITTIILLGRAGVLHAFCPHLGTHLGHGGTVQGNNIVCPYHSWEFDADGRNKWGRPPLLSCHTKQIR